MSITNATQFDGMRVINDTYECAAASCRDQSMGDCTIVRPDSDYAQDGGVRWIELYHSLSKICDNLESELSPDIAGPGVLISYITQTAMALYVWLFVLLLQTKNIIDPLKSTIDTMLGKRCGTATLRPRQPSIIHRLEQTNVAHATSTFLADLHEAQCFFVIAIAIALLYAGSQSAVFTGADNWQSLLRNHDSVNVLAGTGTWPIILTQMSLRRADLDSIYYLILSAVTLVLEAVASDTAIRPEADKVYRMFKGLNNQPACGGNPSLRTFGVDTDYDPYFGPLGSTTIYVYLGLLGVLWWVRFWEWLSATERFQLKFNRLSKTSNIIYVRTAYTLSKMARILIFAAEFSAILIMGFGVASVHSALAGTLDQSDSGSWSVGQVIALMIWAPLLSKYLHLIIHELTPF
ncbi:hypothetical protein FALBO_16264 [Fusarium albosuccineum]|uniref:Uncharacterized protein n=1 Tax=Fusarium albosuccineum TaxID=1237068 RepID=A0A8H4NXW7_9HYPO|nr:hypothetical protein FALBO_16264 [Fusarium albosuccineum]